MRQNDKGWDEDKVDWLSHSRSKKCKEVMKKEHYT